MNFQKLNPVEDSASYLDSAFRKTKSSIALSRKRLQITDNLRRCRLIERTRLDVVNDTLSERFNKIHYSFPDFSKLPLFYKELALATLDFDRLKKALGSVVWTIKRIQKLHHEFIWKVNNVKEVKELHALRNAYYGRVSSVVNEINSDLLYLESARKIMRTYPDVKELLTVAIAGFPNVGKSTLLKKISGSKPEIAPYAFTTKSLNIGYLESGHKKIQLVDTPGTLARPDKMNNIEKQAYLAIRHLANTIIYIFDPTFPYPFEDQVRLLEMITQESKPVIIYISKTDVADKESINLIWKKYPSAISDYEKVKAMITEP